MVTVQLQHWNLSNGGRCKRLYLTRIMAKRVIYWGGEKRKETTRLFLVWTYIVLNLRRCTPTVVVLECVCTYKQEARPTNEQVIQR